MFCPNCGAENKDGSKYCTVCGTELPVQSNKDISSPGVEEKPASKEGKGFFRSPGGVVTIIVIIAVVVVVVFLVFWMRGRGSEAETASVAEQEQTTAEETEIVSEDSEPVSDTDTTAVSGEYILPDSDTRYYTESELSGLTKDQLRLARNEIYARHGRLFDSADLQDYFNGQAWYNGTIASADFTESMLNEYEKANVKTIQSLEDSSKEGSESSTVITSIPSGQSYSCDLNGDGVEETVAVVDDSSQTNVSLLVNGTTCGTIDWAWDGQGYIVDIDTSDNTLQIGVQYDSDDDYTGVAFYGYDAGGAHLLDYIPGSFFEAGTYPNITCAGDGLIQSYKALSIFETWFASATWMLKDGELVELVPNVYEPLDLFDGKGIDLTVLQSISVTEDEPYYGNRITLPVGTKVHMNGTNNIDWVSMTADGYQGTLYLTLDDGYQVLLAGSNEMVFVISVFDNMSNFG